MPPLIKNIFLLLNSFNWGEGTAQPSSFTNTSNNSERTESLKNGTLIEDRLLQAKIINEMKVLIIHYRVNKFVEEGKKPTKSEYIKRVANEDNL